MPLASSARRRRPFLSPARVGWSRRSSRTLRGVVFGGLFALFGASGCGPTVDCEALCARTLACEVEFIAPDDPNNERVRDGTRSELENCALGCQASPLVTVERASCIDELDTRDPAVCQDEVLFCLELRDDE